MGHAPWTLEKVRQVAETGSFADLRNGVGVSGRSVAGLRERPAVERPGGRDGGERGGAIATWGVEPGGQQAADRREPGRRAAVHVHARVGTGKTVAVTDPMCRPRAAEQGLRRRRCGEMSGMPPLGGRGVARGERVVGTRVVATCHPLDTAQPA